MQSNYLFTVIIVNENYEIIDGQHRFEVIKELNLPLRYIICEGYGFAAIGKNEKKVEIEDNRSNFY